MTEEMRAMILSECKKIEEKPLKLTKIKKHSISNPDAVSYTHLRAHET